MKGIKLLALAVTSLAAISSATLALAAVSAPAGWYLDGNLGVSRAQNKNYGVNTKSSTQGIGWGFDVGFKFMPYFGLEAGYTNYAVTQVKNLAGTKVATDSHFSYDLTTKGILPISDSGVELFAKVGVARLYSHTVITNGTAASGLGIPAGKKSATGLYLGVGGDYAFTPAISMTLEWNRAKGTSATGNLDLYSVGVNYTFG